MVHIFFYLVEVWNLEQIRTIPNFSQLPFHRGYERMRIQPSESDFANSNPKPAQSCITNHKNNVLIKLLNIWKMAARAFQTTDGVKSLNVSQGAQSNYKGLTVFHVVHDNVSESAHSLKDYTNQLLKHWKSIFIKTPEVDRHSPTLSFQHAQLPPAWKVNTKTHYGNWLYHLIRDQQHCSSE